MAARAWFDGVLADRNQRSSRLMLPAAARLAQDEDALDDAAFFNAPQDVVETMLETASRRAHAGFEGLFPDHVKPATALVAAGNQWRVNGSQVIALDYASAAIAWKAMEIELTRDEFATFQHLEAEAVKCFNRGGNA